MPDTAIGSVLTDGTKVSPLDIQKFVKDLVADFLLTGASALVTANLMSLTDALQAPQLAAIALGGALIRVVYRAALRWATS